VFKAALFVFRGSNKFDAELGTIHPSDCGQSHMQRRLTIRQEQSQLEILASGHLFRAFEKASWKRNI
jgi:hypothetical protein